MTAVSYDSVEILKTFAERAGIGFPLLADPSYRVIDRFGIINQRIPEDASYYGFPYAGYYVVDEKGVVQSKYFNEENNDRTTAASILIRDFGAESDDRQGEVETKHLTVRLSSSNRALRPGQRGALVLQIEPKGSWHVYSPEVEGYIPVSWRMNDQQEIVRFSPAEFPPAKRLHLPAIGETVPVYDRPFRVVRDIRLLGSLELPEALAGEEKVVVEGELKYQACDDEQCDFPLTLPLRWTFTLDGHDRVRVPEDLRRE